MGLRERLTAAMKAALKARETKRLSAVRLILAAVQAQDIAAKAEKGIPDEEILGLLAKMIKQREEAAATYDSAGRPELAEGERAEIAVIREFMPRQMDPEETKAAIADVIAETGASSMKDMGKAMAALKARYAGQMDFAAASAAVKSALTPK